MNNIVYMNEFCRAYLTTSRLASNYKTPVLSVVYMRAGELPDFESIDKDFGPADRLPSGISAAELICKTYHLQDEETQIMSQSFCRQWPDGPQPGENEA